MNLIIYDITSNIFLFIKMFKLEQHFFNLLKFKSIKCFRCSALQKINAISPTFIRNFHVYPLLQTRKLKGIENTYMYELISSKFPPVSTRIEKVETKQEFEDILNKNYTNKSDATATDILNTFKAVEKFCCLNQIDLSDTRFNNLVDGLMDHCRRLTDHELLQLLLILGRYPRCQSYRDHNYHDIWSCLDDMSCERIPRKDMEYLFKLADAWYLLDLGKLGDYVYNMLDNLARRNCHLTKDHIVKTFFYMNVCRKKQVPFEFEEKLEKFLGQLSIDELGVVALGYFKSKSKIKLRSVMLAMISAVRKECSTANQITLTSILKALRFSKVGQLVEELDHMLNVLVKQLDRLSTQSCLHIAIIGTTTIHFHEESMVKATQRIVSQMDNVQEVRLKDIERLLVAATMFDYRPNVTPDLFETAFKEIQEDRRITELASFPRILPCILGCLSMVNMYSHDLLDRILDTNYIFDTYGTSVGSIGRDIYGLDCAIELECPGYKGNRLPPNLKYRLAKWMIEPIPSRSQYKKLTAYDNLHLDFWENLVTYVGNKDAVKVDYVAPHFGRADMILCKDKKTNKFIEPPGFQRYVFGDLKYALEDPNLSWYAISVIGWNNTIRTTFKPVGMITMKQRHLKKLGYDSKLVVWKEYMNLSRVHKMNFIKSLLS